MRKIFTLFCFLGLLLTARSQTLRLPLNDDYQMDIQAAAYSSGHIFHTALRPWSEAQISKIIDLDSISEQYRLPVKNKNKYQYYILNSILNDDFIRVKGDDFYIAINPIVDFEIGKDNKKTTWVNTRGVELKGNIGNNFAFYTNLRENQAVFPEHIHQYVKDNHVIPGQGWSRSFKGTGFDYNNSTAYIALRPTSWLDATLGYGKNFIGDGYRSMILSDNAFNYPYLRLTADFWRIQYTCLYTQMTDRNRVLSDNTFARKYTVMHYLDIAVTKRLNIGFFDAIVAKAQDSTGIRRGFDLQYLNPIILLRSAEYYAGNSPDNALMGVCGSLILGKHTTLYGQFVLDEMTFKEFIGGKGYYANKQSYQLGVKSYNCFNINGLFLQLEGNIVMPYMYSHTSQGSGCGVGEDNYAHYNEPLAHPWGANLWEVIARAQYNYKRLFFQYKCNIGQYGDDWDVENNVFGNYGHNVYLDYITHSHILDPEEDPQGKYGHYLLTGRKTSLFINNITVSYLVNPAYNLNVFAEITQRHFEAQGLDDKDNLIFSIGIRTSLDRKYYDF